MDKQLRIVSVGPILFKHTERLATPEQRTKWWNEGYDSQDGIKGISYKNIFLTTDFKVRLGTLEKIDNYNVERANKELEVLVND